MCSISNRKGLLLGLLMFWWSLLEYKAALPRSSPRRPLSLALGSEFSLSIFSGRV